MNKEKTILGIVMELIKHGMSALIAVAGIVLIFLGATGYAIVPESFYAGIAIMSFSVVYLIGEIVLKIIKIKKMSYFDYIEERSVENV